MGEPFSANAREPKNSGLWNFPSLPATEFIFPSRSCCSQVVAVVLLLRRTATAMRNTTTDCNALTVQRPGSANWYFWRLANPLAAGMRPARVAKGWSRPNRTPRRAQPSEKTSDVGFPPSSAVTAKRQTAHDRICALRQKNLRLRFASGFRASMFPTNRLYQYLAAYNDGWRQ
jgi:hypothetical protein